MSRVAWVVLCAACSSPARPSAPTAAPAHAACAAEPEHASREALAPEAPTQAGVDALAHAAGLTAVSLHGLMGHGRQCPVASFAALATLDDLVEIEDIPVECLPALRRTAKLPKLAHLSILCGDDTAIDFGELAGFTQLVELRLAFGCRRDARGLTPLAALPHLVTLADPDSTELAGIASLPQLEDLAISSAKGDLAELAALHRLRKLDLQLYAPADLAPLGTLTALEKLTLETRDAVDVAPFAGLHRLQQLVIRTAPQLVHEATLGKLATLCMLEVGDSGITELAPLGALPYLTSLRVDVRRVGSLAGLAGARRLQHLDLVSGCTPVTIDLAPLVGLSRLEDVVLSGVIDATNQGKLTAQVMHFAPHHCHGVAPGVTASE